MRKVEILRPLSTQILPTDLRILSPKHLHGNNGRLLIDLAKSQEKLSNYSTQSFDSKFNAFSTARKAVQFAAQLIPFHQISAGLSV